MSNPANNSKGKRIVRTTSRAVDNIVLLTLLVCLLFAGWSLWDTHRMYEDSDSVIYEQYKPSKNPLSFDELRAMNSDVIGWIDVYDTKIDYPILHSKEDADYYLSRTPLKEFEATGSIYMDQSNQRNFSDFNTILYGHHMSGHSMFGDVDLFKDRQFFNTHEYADLYYSPTGEAPFIGEHHGVQFFAFISTQAYDNLLYSPGVKTVEVQQNYLNHLLAIADFKRDVDVSTSDRILVLSTCSEDNTNGRFVLVGRILDAEATNPFPEQEDKLVNGYLDLFNIFDNFMKLPIWLWILILLILIALTWSAYYFAKRKYKIKRDKYLEYKAWQKNHPEDR